MGEFRKCFVLALAVVLTVKVQGNPSKIIISEKDEVKSNEIVTSGREFAASPEDGYLNAIRDACVDTKDALTCGKYRTFRYVHDLITASASVSEGRGIAFGGLVKLVTILPAEEARVPFGEVEHRSSDTEWEKVYKFGLREISRFLRTHALTVHVGTTDSAGRSSNGESPRLIDEDHINGSLEEGAEGRGKKKKIAMLLPLLMFFKLKALIVPTLLAVLFIKKLLILATVLVPGLLSLVKVCKTGHHGSAHHGFHHGYSSGPDVSAEYSTGYGQPHFGKEYARRSGARWNAGQGLAYRGYPGAAEGAAEGV